MADTAQLLFEMLTKIMSDITAMVIRQLEREKKSVNTVNNNVVRQLMECDVGAWRTVVRNDRGKLRSRPDNTTFGTGRTVPGLAPTHANIQPASTATTARRTPPTHSPVRRETRRDTTPEQRRREKEYRREYRETQPAQRKPTAQIWTNRNRARQRTTGVHTEHRTRPVQQHYRTGGEDRREGPRDFRRNTRREG